MLCNKTVLNTISVMAVHCQDSNVPTDARFCSKIQGEVPAVALWCTNVQSSLWATSFVISPLTLVVVCQLPVSLPSLIVDPSTEILQFYFSQTVGAGSALGEAVGRQRYIEVSHYTPPCGMISWCLYSSWYLSRCTSCIGFYFGIMVKDKDH